jgi:hypothetical protein
MSTLVDSFVLNWAGAAKADFFLSIFFLQNGGLYPTRGMRLQSSHEACNDSPYISVI